MSSNPYSEYRAASVTGRSALELTIMIFDGLERFLEQAKDRAKECDSDGAQNLLRKARRIVLHLIPLVNDTDGGEAAARLRSLYFFCLEKILKASFEDEFDEIDQALKVVRILQETWTELQTQERVSRPSGAVLQSTAVA